MNLTEKEPVYVKFYFKLGKMVTETLQLLQTAYREDTLSQKKCFEWFKCFRKGRTLTENDQRPGWPSTSTNEEKLCTTAISSMPTVDWLLEKLQIKQEYHMALASTF
jgi:hypothetical protein